MNCSIVTAFGIEECALMDIDIPTPGATRGGDVAGKTPPYSSLADDVVYILQKCIDRALATGYADVVCAILNNTVGALKQWLLSMLVERVNKSHGWPGRHGQDPMPTSSLCALNSLDVCAQNLGNLERRVVANARSSFPEGTVGHRKVRPLALMQLFCFVLFYPRIWRVVHDHFDFKFMLCYAASR